MKVAVVGATGLVGRIMIQVLEERFGNKLDIFPITSKGGNVVYYNGKPLETIPIKDFGRYDFALFAVDADISREFAPKFVEKGSIVIDNSSAFRLDEDTPLVVPEVNPEELKQHKGIIANPNCSTIQMVVALNNLEKHIGISRITISTYQSVSGAGKKALEVFNEEVKGIHRKDSPFPKPIFPNVIPVIGSLHEGYNTEEWKLVNETRKIFKRNDLHIGATAVRVPVNVGHAESIEFELMKNVRFDEVEDLISSSEGVVYSKDEFFTPIDVEGKDEVFVSRLRKHPSLKNVFLMWVVADNLRKGAATNAVQIMELLIHSV